VWFGGGIEAMACSAGVDYGCAVCFLGFRWDCCI
jgi:hypothetical protein